MQKLPLLIFLPLAFSAGASPFDLPAAIGDNMVLQQQTRATLWGFDRPSSDVEVRASWTDRPS